MLVGKVFHNLAPIKLDLEPEHLTVGIINPPL